jgi:hypothetical protein
MNALGEIAAERRRQIEVEGWTHAHDDGHDDGSLAAAAACHAATLIIAEIERLDRLAAKEKS